MVDEPLTVLIVEDSLETAHVLRDIIQGEPDMTIVGLALTGQEGVRRAAEMAPDVIIMDSTCRTSTASRPPRSLPRRTRMPW